jgi:Protein of unknown function (DUF2783)
MNMAILITTPNIPGPDDFYAELLALHDGRPTDESHAINAKLVLLLANHIGDREVICQAFAAAETDKLPVRQDSVSVAAGQNSGV